MFKTKWRIVTDNYRGFEPQEKPWWSPFYWPRSRTFSTIEECRAYIKRSQRRVVEYVND